MGLLSIIRPSIVHPSVAQFSLNLMHRFFQILVVASPEPYARIFFEFLKKKMFFFLFLFLALSAEVMVWEGWSVVRPWH